MKTFSEWITEKFLDWQKSAGERKTLVEFADWIGVSQPSLSDWMSGKYKPKGSKNIDRLYIKLGPEIFDVLEMERPPYALQFVDDYIQNIAKAIAELPAEYRASARKVIQDTLDEFMETEVNKDE
jgi:hypothetical protein